MNKIKSFIAILLFVSVLPAVIADTGAQSHLPDERSESVSWRRRAEGELDTSSNYSWNDAGLHDWHRADQHHLASNSTDHIGRTGYPIPVTSGKNPGGFTM